MTHHMTRRMSKRRAPIPFPENCIASSTFGAGLWSPLYAANFDLT